MNQIINQKDDGPPVDIPESIALSVGFPRGWALLFNVARRYLSDGRRPGTVHAKRPATVLQPNLWLGIREGKRLSRVTGDRFAVFWITDVVTGCSRPEAPPPKPVRVDLDLISTQLVPLWKVNEIPPALDAKGKAPLRKPSCLLFTSREAALWIAQSATSYDGRPRFIATAKKFVLNAQSSIK